MSRDERAHLLSLLANHPNNTLQRIAKQYTSSIRAPSKSQQKRERRNGPGGFGESQEFAQHVQYMKGDTALVDLLHDVRSWDPSTLSGRLIHQTDAVIDAMPALLSHPEHEVRLGNPIGHIPGCILLVHVDDDLNVFKEGERYPLELHQAPLDDQIFPFLKSVLQAKHIEERPDYFKPNVLLWVLSFFEQKLPTHLLSVNLDGDVALTLVHNRLPCSAQPSHAPIYLQALARRVPFDSLPRLLDTSPLAKIKGYADSYRSFSGLQYAIMAASRAKVDVRDLISAMLAEKVSSDAQLKSLREAMIADATARRKAALAAKNAQLDTCRARLQEAERQILLLHKKVKEAEAKADAAFSATSPGALVAAPSEVAPAAFDDSTPAAVDDEAYFSLNEAVEHQAAVIRELNLSLRHALTSSADPDAPAEPSMLKRSLQDLDDWAAENGERVIVLRRAIAAAKKSNFHDPDLVFEALEIIAGAYRDVKLGIADRMAFKRACDKACLDLGGSISEAPSEDYEFWWRGRRRFLDQHVGKGVSRDPKYCMRIYFTWDEELAKVIIGWLPSHLPTRVT